MTEANTWTHDLPTQVWARVEPILKAFEQTWQAGQRPNLADFLSSTDAASLPLLTKLVHLDLEYRLKAGEPARVESYLQRYPDLARDSGVVLNLLAAEYSWRRQREPNLEMAEYLDRFPQYRAELLARLSGASVAEAGPTTNPEATPSPHSWPLEGPQAPPFRVGEVRVGSALADYEILGELGRGGMGVVYRALDRRRQTVAALKTLPWLEPAALYRFKQEFRALAGLSHPNLVVLHELVGQGQQWFLTMEFVAGVDFLTHIRSGGASLPTQGPGPLPAGEQRAPVPASLDPEQLVRLRKALRQLVEGVQALHERGVIHRDLKPSNVLVSETGRVVILDFGLAAELNAAGLYQSTARGLVGTVAYMAPEQAGGLPVSPASDWYSVGVMLYEALTGRLPFGGSAQQMLEDKQQQQPTPPRDLVADVPEDLHTLCIALLHREPTLRPAGQEVLRQLGSASALLVPSRACSSATAAKTPFVGREYQRRELAEAFRLVLGGRPAVVCVQGRSGVGKSALVQQFLDELAAGEQAVILAGRCYEHEAVPYKAVDSVLDALSRYLRRIPPPEAEALLPRDVLQLARVFPVLRTVRAVARAPGRSFEIPNPQELRRRAFAALRELLARLGDRRPLVLALDDLQWGDTDSAALLAELLRPPDSPVLLLVGSYRSEDVHTSPFLGLFRSLLASSGPTLDQRELTVEPLTRAEARTLALRLLARDDPEAQTLADAVAAESGGNPFFVHELVQHFSAGQGSAGAARPTGRLALDQVLAERIARLPEEARRLLEVVAVHGQPLRKKDARRAALLQTDERPALAVLCSGQLLRSTGSSERDQVETYHDRVRETVAAHLEPDVLAKHHANLARTLEAEGGAEPEVLAVHFLGAGELETAGRYYARAANQAAEALAFERAAKLYHLALGLGSREAVEEQHLRSALGDALANAGRGAEAADAYLKAAGGRPVRDTLDLHQRAALQYLISGHTDIGIATFQTVLAALGMKWPSTPRRALLALLCRQLQLRLRGLGFRRRDASQVPVDDLRRIDVCSSAATGLAAVDTIRGMYFQTRSLLLALQAGEPYRIARGLATEAGHISAGGVFTRARTVNLLALADRLAREVGHPHALGTVALWGGIAEYLIGNWRNARERCDRAETIFREQCTGAAWELDMVHTISLWSLTYLGGVAELTCRREELLKEARERGDRFAVTMLGTYIMALARLGADDPEGAQQELNQVMGEWSRQGFHVQHHNALLAQVLIHLYQGNGPAAWESASRAWPSYAGSLLLRIQQVHIDALQSHARSALAAAGTIADPKPLLRAAERDARLLEKQQAAWAGAYARLIRAGIAATQRERDRARMLLGEAASAFEAADMGLCAAAARRRLGLLLGGAEGQALVTAADAWMQGQKIQDPARMAAVYTPGFPE